MQLRLKRLALLAALPGLYLTLTGCALTDMLGGGGCTKQGAQTGDAQPGASPAAGATNLPQTGAPQVALDPGQAIGNLGQTAGNAANPFPNDPGTQLPQLTGGPVNPPPQQFPAAPPDPANPALQPPPGPTISTDPPAPTDSGPRVAAGGPFTAPKFDPPAILQKTPGLPNITDSAQRPLPGDRADLPSYTQLTPVSCGIASSRGIIQSLTGKDVPEDQLRVESAKVDFTTAYDPNQGGTSVYNLPKLLQAEGVNASPAVDYATRDAKGNPTSVDSNRALDDLSRSTATGSPAIVRFLVPSGGVGSAQTGHFRIVDGVKANPDGTRSVFGRDPATGDTFSLTQAQFAQQFGAFAITTTR